MFTVKRKKLFLITFLVFALATIFYFIFLKGRSVAPVFKTVKVERGDLSTVVTSIGSINALTTVLVGAQVSGTISELFADFNSVVKNGQVIALIDTTFLAASKAESGAAVEKAKVQLKQMKIELDRITYLYDNKAIPKSDFDLALSNYENAVATLKATQAQWIRSVINLQYATIRAPISGIVISRDVDVGQTVVSSFNTPTLFTIAKDLTKMQVYANVDEADIGQIKIGQEATFNVDAYPNELFSGLIKQIRLKPNVIQNVVNYTVIIDVPNPDLKLLPGLTANIDVTVQERENVLKLPSAALRFVPSAEQMETLMVLPDSVKKYFQSYKTISLASGYSVYVWIKTAAGVFPKRVTVGLIEGGFAEVSGELKESDEVVVGIFNKNENDVAKNPFMPSFSPHRRNK